MKRLALFVAISVGVFAAWEVSKYALQNENADSATNDTPEPNDSPMGSFSDVVASIFTPVEDIVVTAKRAVFGTPYDDLIDSSANQYGIPPQVLYKLLWTESRFRPDIIDGRTKSPTGALGIAQFMPATAVQELGSVQAALDPNQAIPGAARYLAKLQRQSGGDLTKAVAAYNWGIGNVKKKGLTSAPGETVNYVLSILGINLRA